MSVNPSGITLRRRVLHSRHVDAYSLSDLCGDTIWKAVSLLCPLLTFILFGRLSCLFKTVVLVNRFPKSAR